MAARIGSRRSRGERQTTDVHAASILILLAAAAVEPSIDAQNLIVSTPPSSSPCDLAIAIDEDRYRPWRLSLRGRATGVDVSS